MPIPDRLRNIIESLLRASREDQVLWKESPRIGTFFVPLSKFSVQISADQSHTVRIAIVNAEGREIDWLYEPFSPHHDYDVARELFDLARRKALNVDDALREIDQELATGGVIGVEPEKPEPANGDDIPF